DGGGAVTISGNHTDRVIAVSGGVKALLTGLTIRDGHSNIGGGISNYATLTVGNSTLSGDTATSFGGGIRNFGTLMVRNSTISGNSAGLNGGGISNYSKLTVNNSTLSGNSAHYGGGISNYLNRTLTVINSTLRNNSASFDGGGIDNGGMLTITGATFSGN